MRRDRNPERIERRRRIGSFFDVVHHDGRIAIVVGCRAGIVVCRNGQANSRIRILLVRRESSPTGASVTLGRQALRVTSPRVPTRYA
jgi:hypothetical protein